MADTGDLGVNGCMRRKTVDLLLSAGALERARLPRRILDELQRWRKAA